MLLGRTYNKIPKTRNHLKLIEPTHGFWFQTKKKIILKLRKLSSCLMHNEFKRCTKFG